METLGVQLRASLTELQDQTGKMVLDFCSTQIGAQRLGTQGASSFSLASVSSGVVVIALLAVLNEDIRDIAVFLALALALYSPFLIFSKYPNFKIKNTILIAIFFPV